jgi:hypothetical protein
MAENCSLCGKPKPNWRLPSKMAYKLGAKVPKLELTAPVHAKCAKKAEQNYA